MCFSEVFTAFTNGRKSDWSDCSLRFRQQARSTMYICCSRGQARVPKKEWHFIWMTCHQEKGFLVGGGIPELVISLRHPCNPSHPPPSPLSGICIFAALPILWPLLQIRLLSSVHDVTPGPALETLFCCGHDVAQFSWGPNLSKFLKPELQSVTDMADISV